MSDAAAQTYDLLVEMQADLAVVKRAQRDMLGSLDSMERHLVASRGNLDRIRGFVTEIKGDLGNIKERLGIGAA